jgi:hypothetical protein
LRDHSHIPLEDSGVCAHCGQPLPKHQVVTYDQQGSNRTGLIATVLLHLLLVAIWFYQPPPQKSSPAKSGDDNAIVWLPPAPSTPTPTPKPQQPAKSSKASPSKPAPRAVAKVQRLPNTITLPKETPTEQPPTPPKEESKAPPQELDMQAYIEARKKARGAPAQADQGEESAAARGTRNALANIAAINGRGGQDPNETGGVFSVTNKSFSTADLKFRGWNPNFKRRWLTAVTVERGSDPDIETAIVRKMIELIRKEKTGDFEWDSHRLNRVVTLSARPQDTQELTNFLFKEMFPDYKPPRG